MSLTQTLVDMPQWTWLVFGGLIFRLFVLGYLRGGAAGYRLPLPPGPKGWPIIGNLLEFPKRGQPRYFHKLAQTYGDVVHLKVLGQRMVILNTVKAAQDLLEKRSSVYSDRPPAVMSTLAGYGDWSVVNMGYGQQWRTYRRAYHQRLLPNELSQYEEDRLQITYELLRKLLEDPSAFMEHIKATFASTALRVAYGIDLSSDEKNYLRMLRSLVDVGAELAVPGKYFVELFPALQHLPAWVPGAGFKKYAHEVKGDQSRVLKHLYAKGKETERNSILSSELRKGEHLEEREFKQVEEVTKGVAAMAYVAGADTTEASVQAFILAMVLHPDVQDKAQKELDAVIGRKRLPTFEDRPSLPYINAIVKELVRWHVVAPTGVPHAAIRDDEYNGLFIPGNTMIICNAWSMSRDPDMFPDPECFVPERFLSSQPGATEVLDPYTFIFGFGRRICPGRHLADASLFIMCASVLHAFQITPPVDKTGVPRPVEAKFTDHLITSHAEHFECDFRPRWEGATELITSATS